ALALMTPVEYILKENKNCNMWWTHTLPLLCNEIGVNFA
ncbi:IS481 family transposase, partial [Escherichia coli]